MGIAEAAVRQQRIARDDAAGPPAEPRVEPLGVAARGVEDQQRLAELAGPLLGRDHQRRADAVPARPPVHEHLRYVGTVRLVLGLLEHELYRADDAVLVLG